jgi:hypothetical protein
MEQAIAEPLLDLIASLFQSFHREVTSVARRYRNVCPSCAQPDLRRCNCHVQ